MVVHPQTVTKAHQGTCAAGKQGKFVEYYHAFWEQAFTPYAQTRDPSKLGEENVVAIAKNVGMDPVKFRADMNSDECAKFVENDMRELAKFKVNATPAFFINGQFVGGALPEDGFKKIIDEQLKKAEASGVPAAQYYDHVIMAQGVKQFRSAADSGAQ